MKDPLTTAPASIEAARTLPARSLGFWFDYTCPFAYLASTQVRALAGRMGVPVTYEPVLLGGIFKAVGTAQNLFATRSAQRSAHEAADMARWAALLGVPAPIMPAEHPMRSVEALRATLATNLDPAVIAGFFEAYWVQNRAISDRDVVREIVAAAGHNPDVVLRLIDEASIKDDLRRRTERAVDLGIFGVPTYVVDGTHLYWGQDRMPFVEGARTPERNRGERAQSSRAIEAYWDFSSPFGYLGVHRLTALAAQTGVTVVWKPILLGGLFRAVGSPDVPLATFSVAKQRYVLKDIERWAELYGLPFRFPSRFPIASLKALRVYLALPEEHQTAFRDAVFRAAWAEDRDITDDGVLAACVGADVVAREALARASSDPVKNALRASTEDAARHGVFGVPTFRVGDELFWGQDRLDLALAEALRA